MSDKQENNASKPFNPNAGSGKNPPKYAKADKFNKPSERPLKGSPE